MDQLTIKQLTELHEEFREANDRVRDLSSRVVSQGVFNKVIAGVLAIVLFAVAGLGVLFVRVEEDRKDRRVATCLHQNENRATWLNLAKFLEPVTTTENGFALLQFIRDNNVLEECA